MRTSAGGAAPAPTPLARSRGPAAAAPGYEWQPPPPSVPHPLGLDVGLPPTKRPRIPEDPYNIDTVASVGAREAGYDEHNLRAFFESLPGFLEFKGNPRMGGGFAKFSSSSFAQQAVESAVLEGVPAEMAKSSMGTTGTAGGGGIAGGGGVAPRIVQRVVSGGPVPRPTVAVGRRSSVPEAFTQIAPLGAGGGAKRSRIPEDPNQVDTVASVGAKEAGYDEDHLRAFFEQCPGFVTFKANPRMGGGFAKFSSPDLATDAVATAQEQGIPAEIARSSMSTT